MLLGDSVGGIGLHIANDASEWDPALQVARLAVYIIDLDGCFEVANAMHALTEAVIESCSKVKPHVVAARSFHGKFVVPVRQFPPRGTFCHPRTFHDASTILATVATASAGLASGASDSGRLGKYHVAMAMMRYTRMHSAPSR